MLTWYSIAIGCPNLLALDFDELSRQFRFVGLFLAIPVLLFVFQLQDDRVISSGRGSK